ncbi:MAG TPA: protein translocase subunit SecD [Candidatus Baltobacteraceae bacterium]|jgi:preprotein translocase subunit SecD|nr:protein translocase subunit SecD [Candidatus Baltobacteraceae bacterium]
MWHRLKTPLKALFLLGIIALCLSSITPLQKKIRLGLDLQGGVRVLLQLTATSEVPHITPQIQTQVMQVIQNRINGLGVSEPTFQAVGQDRILVELPNVKDPDEAVRQLKDVAKLDFKIVPDGVAARAERDSAYANDPAGSYKDSGLVVYSGAQLKGAQASFDQSGRPKIDFQTKDPVAFGKLTKDNMSKLLGIFLDKRFISAPRIEGIIAGEGEITGSFTTQETTRIANELNAGALPVPISVIENDTVGPILGQIDLVKSLWAAIIGLGLVLVFMLVVYRLPGFLADLALVIYVLMLLALLAEAKAVLTLPGIAGFVLSVGMAVDANVLIFERIKEELWAGQSLRAAVRVGFSRAFSAVFDSHFTTIVGAGVLFALGTGTVKGFAYTLLWGTVFSLVTAVFVTRFFMDVVVETNAVTNHKAYGA